MKFLKGKNTKDPNSLTPIVMEILFGIALQPSEKEILKRLE